MRAWRYSPPANAPAHTTVTINFTLAEPSSSDKKSGKYKPTTKGVYPVGGDVVAPAGISMPMPAYSKEALKAKLQGTVVLSIVVNSDGNVSDVHVVKPLGKGLDENAVETARTWKFKPGTRNGVPVPVLITVEVAFRLA